MTITKEERTEWRRLLDDGVLAVTCPRCHVLAGAECVPLPDCDPPDEEPAGKYFPHVARVRALDKALAGRNSMLRRCLDALDEAEGLPHPETDWGPPVDQEAGAVPEPEPVGPVLDPDPVKEVAEALYDWENHVRSARSRMSGYQEDDVRLASRQFAEKLVAALRRG